MIMIRGIQMSTGMSGQGDELHGPPQTAGQLFFF
jgi:hypothetical protein